MEGDQYYMSQCFDLALGGCGFTSPNPMVGAIFVKDGKIIGKGYHKKFGADHAEIDALKNCKEDPKGATLYVNLEPCCHFGKTPPCAAALIKAGIKEAVVGINDPNPLVLGRGVTSLEKAGILVRTGVLGNKARFLNRFYLHWISSGKPYVVAKAAISRDFKIASGHGEQTAITGAKAQVFVHKLRHQCDSILVGVGTVLTDNPLLTDRFSDVPRDPLRVILDSTLRSPLDAKVFNSKKVLLATTPQADEKQKKAFACQGIEAAVFSTKQNRVDLSGLLSFLGKRGITSVLVEGGRKVFDSFMKENLIDEWYIFRSKFIIGTRGVDVCSDLSSFKSIMETGESTLLGSDTLFHCLINQLGNP